jgi:hypothetical protein
MRVVSKNGGNACSSKGGRGRLLGDVFARKARRGRPWCDRGARSESRTCVRFVFGNLFLGVSANQDRPESNKKKGGSLWIPSVTKSRGSVPFVCFVFTALQSHDIIVARAWARVCAYLVCGIKAEA